MHLDKMEKFEFLIGEWDLAYNIPETIFCKAMTDIGTGTFKRMLKDNYVLFEYATQSGSEAKGIFGWDKKTEIYRYWWFENSGNFLTATCQFINENTLFLNWHDTLLRQTFTRETPDRVILQMDHPDENKTYQNILEVVLTRIN